MEIIRNEGCDEGAPEILIIYNSVISDRAYILPRARGQLRQILGKKMGFRFCGDVKFGNKNPPAPRLDTAFGQPNTKLGHRNWTANLVLTPYEVGKLVTEKRPSSAPQLELGTAIIGSFLSCWLPYETQNLVNIKYEY